MEDLEINKLSEKSDKDKYRMYHLSVVFKI